MAVLRLVPAAGAAIQVEKDQAIVGREPACDVFVNDGSVSRRHARLERRGAAWFVVDQGSANGTYLDSQRVSDALLRPGQELRFGAVPFKVELLGGVPSAEGTVMAPAGGFGFPAPPAPPRPVAPPAAPPPMAPPRPATPPLAAPPPWGAPPPPGPPQWPGAPPAPPRPGAPPPPAPMAPPRPAPAPAARPSAPPPPGHADTAPYQAGAPVRRGPRPPRTAAAAAEAPPPGKQGRGALFWVGTGCGGCLLAVLLLVGGAIGLFYYAAKGPRDALVTHLENVKAGKVDAAYDGLSEPYKQAVSRPAFAAFVARHPALKDYGDIAYRNYSASGSRAVISGYVTSAKGERETASFALAQEGGHWKITGMEISADHPEAQQVQGPGGLRMDPVEVMKSAAGDTIEIRLGTNVAGFDVRPEGGQFGIDLAVDVETVGPDGLRMDALSRDDVQHFQRTTSMEKGAVAPIMVPLTLDKSLLEGVYTVRLKVRDRVSGGEVSQEAKFTLP